MIIKEINRKEFQFFYDLNSNIQTTFLQLPLWGDFQESLGYKVMRLGIYHKNQLQAITQVIKIKAKRGSFLFIPHGPIFNSIIIKNTANFSNLQLINSLIGQLLNYLISIAKKENYSFIRIAPILENRQEYHNIFQKLGFKTAPIYMHAETTWVLPLDKKEDELLTNMRKTTRYLIKKAIREKVVVEERNDQKAIDDFYKIYQETAQREKFIPFSKNFISQEFNIFNKNGQALLLFGKGWQTNNLASALIIFTKSTAFYHQGASLHTKIPATYLLQWEAIHQAKKRGCRFYNFWGIYDEQSKRTPKSWQGLTLFKTGFGGKIIRYLPTQDYILSPKYYLTYFWEKFLKSRRGI